MAVVALVAPEVAAVVVQPAAAVLVAAALVVAALVVVALVVVALVVAGLQEVVLAAPVVAQQVAQPEQEEQPAARRELLRVRRRPACPAWPQQLHRLRSVPLAQWQAQPFPSRSHLTRLRR